MTAPPPILSGLLGLALVAALTRHADAALYADGTTSAQTLAFGAPFAGRAMQFRINVPGVGTCQRNTSASFLNNRYAITSAHNVTDLLQYNPTYEVADGTSVVEATPRRFYDTLAWADRIRA